MKKYDNYRDSGVEWLGEVPAHWEMRRGKLVFSVIDDRSETGEEMLLSVSENHGVVPRNTINVTMFQAASYVGYKLCQPDDLVINSLWAWSRGLGFSSHTGIVSTAYSVYRLKNQRNNASYFNYLLRTQLYVDQFNNHSKGIWKSRLQLSDWSFLEIPMILPPPTEQTAIANYLDEKCAQIDRFITKKQRLIQLLEEKRQAVLNRAVTRGLDDAVPLRDSGVAWLGEVPAHWEVRKLKYVASVQTGKTPPIASSEIDYFKDGTVKWFTPGDVSEGQPMRNAQRLVREEAVSDCHVQLFPENAVYLISIGGTLGKVGFSPSKASCNQQINAIVFDRTVVDPEYGFNWLLSNKLNIKSVLDYTTLPILTQTKTKELEILIPPSDEQQSILSFIRNNSKVVDNSIQKINQEITLLQEYRTALIAEAVTGKIDVR